MECLMKKINFLVLALSLSALLPLQSQARVDSGSAPVAERPGDLYIPSPTDLVMPRPEEVGGGVETGSGADACELDSEVISGIDFYIRNCLVARDESFTDIDTTLQCTLNAPVYRSLCLGSSAGSRDSDHPSIETTPTEVSTDEATAAVNACLRTYHCTLASAATPPDRPGPGAPGALAVSSISPSTAQEGSAAFTLTVRGSNFLSSSTVLWNGRSKTTTYVSATELHAQVDAADIAHAGTVPVTVSTGSVVSTSSATFTISAAISTTTGGTTPPPPRTDRTGPETTIDVPLAPAAADGGCALGGGSSASMNFGVVMLSFLMGSYLMLRREKKQ